MSDAVSGTYRIYDGLGVASQPAAIGETKAPSLDILFGDIGNVDVSDDKSAVSTVLKTLRDRAAMHDPDSIEVLVNLTLRQDAVGKKAEGILFNLFSGTTEQGAAPIKSGVDAEIARQSLKLYEYANLTFSVEPSGDEPAGASGIESKDGKLQKGRVEIRDGEYVSKYLHDFRDSVIDSKSSSFPPSSRFLYMAGAGAHAEAEKARAALEPARQVYSAAEKDARRANEAADAALAALLAQGHPAPSRSQELVSSQTALDHAREQFEGAKTHAKEAGDLVAKIGGRLVANGALGPEIKHKPASLWDRGRFLDNKEVEAAIKGALTESSGAERFFYPEGAVYLADLDNGMLDSNLSSIRTETSLNFPVQVHDHWVLINARRKTDKADWQLTAFSSERAYSADSGRTQQSYFKDKNVEKLISALREKLGVKSPTAFAEYNLQGQGAPNTCGLYVALAIKALATDPQASAKEVFDGVAVTYARTDSRKQFNIDQRRQLFGTMVNQAESEAKAKVGDAREQRRNSGDRSLLRSQLDAGNDGNYSEAEE